MSYDIHIEGLPEELVQGLGFVTFGDYATPQKVDGIYKVINRFLKCFLTPRGSDPADTEYGTTLMANFGNTYDPRTGFSLAAQAVEEVTTKIREYDSEYQLPDEERLFSVEIDDFQSTDSQDGFILTVTITNVANTAARFAVPIGSTGVQ